MQASTARNEELGALQFPAATVESGQEVSPASTVSVSAIPAVSQRQASAALWPFTYTDSAEDIRQTLADYDGILGRERSVLAWALKNGRRLTSIKSREFIDHVELRRRNGLAKLRALETQSMQKEAA